MNEVSFIFGLSVASHCRRTVITFKNNIKVGLNYGLRVLIVLLCWIGTSSGSFNTVMLSRILQNRGSFLTR